MLSRRVAAVLPAATLVTVAVVGGLGWAVQGGRALRLDRWADHRLFDTGARVHQAAFWLRDIGDPMQFTCLVAVVLLLWKWCAGLGPAIAMGCGVVVNLVLIEYVLKPFIARNPPHNHGHTFPSGHSGAAFGLATTVAVLLAQPPVARHLRRWLRVALATVLYVIAAGVGIAMVVTRAHYLTDVIGGVPIGILMPLLSAALYDWMARRRSPSDGPDPKSGEPQDMVAGQPGDAAALNPAHR